MNRPTSEIAPATTLTFLLDNILYFPFCVLVVAAHLFVAYNLLSLFF